MNREMIIEWNQFIPSVIATLLGFGLALIAQRLYDEMKYNVARRKMIDSFISEIESTLETIKTINFNLMLSNPIKIPVWKSAISSNKIVLLLDEEWYHVLFLCYNRLEDYNEWHNIRTRLILEKNNEKADLIAEILKDQGKKKENSTASDHLYTALLGLHKRLTEPKKKRSLICLLGFLVKMNQKKKNFQ